jgi:membrane protease YdiL (CAAX protease family)
MRYAFLLWILVVLPLLAWRSMREIRRAREAGEPLPPRTQIYAGTLVLLAVLFLLSLLTARVEAIPLFQVPALGLREIAAGVLAFLGSLGLRAVSEALRTPEERRNLLVTALIPRTSGEWALYVVMSLLAALAEEAAYRGVGMALLRDQVGAPLATLGMALGFALAHLVQEWKSVGLVFLMALLMHGLVSVTGTVVVAMLVHAIYDVTAGVLARRHR